MKSRFLLVSACALLGMLIATSAAAKKPYLQSVNSTCATNYDCGLCHVDPSGAGERTADGEAYLASGYDATIFCPGPDPDPCVDGDGDGFFTGSGDCGTLDCDDSNAAINPGVSEICDDGSDNDCDNKVDCSDGECGTSPLCSVTSGPEICDDGIDNDGDNKADCADKRDCGKDLFCVIDDGGGSSDVEICNDGIDNDGDGKADCADKKDCGKSPMCG